MPSFTYATQIAGIVSFIGFIPYIIGIIKGRVVPSFATWLVWSIIGFILLLSYIKTATDLSTSIWVPLSYTVGPVIICFFSFRKGLVYLGKLDLICLTIALSSLVISLVIQNYFLSLLLSLFADSLGAFPTVLKSYKNPESEDLTAWIFFFIGNTLNIAFIHYDLSTLYPLYLLVLSSVIIFFLIHHKIKRLLHKE